MDKKRIFKEAKEFKNKEECGHTLSSRKIEGEKNEFRKK